MKRRHDAVEIWFYERMLRMPWMGHVRDEEILRKMKMSIVIT